MQPIVTDVYRTSLLGRSPTHGQQMAALRTLYFRAQAYMSTHVCTTPANGISHILAPNSRIKGTNQ
ncbi:MAG: hypothetical protein ACKOOI_20790 [Pirellula sp.]